METLYGKKSEIERGIRRVRDDTRIFTDDPEIIRILNIMALNDKMGITREEYDKMDAYEKNLALMVIKRIEESQKSDNKDWMND